MIRLEETIVIGKFHKTHALKGELNGILDIDDSYVKKFPLIVETDGIFVPYFVENLRNKGAMSHLIKLHGVDSEEEAKKFVNKEIRMLRTDVKEWMDEIEEESMDSLIGYSIIDKYSGKVIGRIEDVEDSTENVIFVVEGEKGETFVPATDAFIERIDDDRKIIIMQLPDGLLDLNQNQ